MRKISIALMVCLCLMLAETGVAAAAFMKIDGIDGEARDKDHKGWIPLTSVSHTIHKPGTGSTTRRRGDVVLEDITVAKTADASSAKLAEAVCKGKVFPKVEIHVSASYSDTRQTYYTYELTNVRVSKYSVSATDVDGVPVEDVSLHFEEIKVAYTQTGKPKSKGQTADKWKIEKEGE